MPRIKVSDYIANRLKQHYGTTRFFMVSGGGAMHLNNSLGSALPYIANHHEQACAIAAEGYARASGKLAVVNVTTGPGGLNCLNGVFGQWTDSVPVLYISGQVKYSTTIASAPNIPLRQLGDQEVDIISVVKPLTKYAVMITDPSTIKYHLDKAIYAATHGRFGAVWLDVPMNIQSAIIDENNLQEFTLPKEEEYNLKINEVITKLQTAKKPLIIAGHGIILAKQQNNFFKLLEKLNVPVATTFNSFGFMPSSNKNYIGRIGTVGQRAANFILQQADLILCLGTRNNIRQVSYNYENFAKNAFKIVVDIDNAELEKPTIKPDIEIKANLNKFIPALLNSSINISKEAWLKNCKELEQKYVFENIKEYQNTTEINPYYFTHLLTEKIKESNTIILGNGTACVAAFAVADVKNNQQYILNSGNASMGFDLPAAIGACAALNKPVICLTGDGSIMMNLQELETIAFNKLPIKIFVINNAGYSSIRQTQRNFFNGNMTGSGEDSGVGMPNFIEVAKAFGIKTFSVNQIEKLDKTIDEVLNINDEPVFCEVKTIKEYSFSPKLSAKTLADGTMVSPSLEDMSPFLRKEEFNNNIELLNNGV